MIGVAKKVQVCTKYTSAKWALIYILFFYAMFFTNGWFVAKWADETAELVVHNTDVAQQVAEDWDKP